MVVEKSAEEATAELVRLFVHPDSRGRAIGEGLVRAAMAHAQANGRRLVLDVMAKDRAAIRLYERLGWTCYARTKHPYGDGLETEALCYASPTD
nr:GNAT family N-acetyltransferase [Streptomyces sp. NBRC 109706]